VKLPEVEYEAPTTVAEAIDLLAEHGDEASVLAGGQSVLALLGLGLGRPAGAAHRPGAALPGPARPRRPPSQ